MICIVDVRENFERMSAVAPRKCRIKFIEAERDSASELVEALCRAVEDDDCEIILFPWILFDVEAVKRLVIACTKAGAKVVILPVWPEEGIGGCRGLNGHYEGLSISESMVKIACEAQGEERSKKD